MTGDSAANNDVRTDYYSFEFHSAFALVRWQRGADWLSARNDGVAMHLRQSDDFFNSDRGHAWTA